MKKYLLIHDPDYIGKGLGGSVIQAFITYVKEREPSMRAMIADPELENIQCIKAFAKSGFLVEGEIATPNGAALLMRLKL